MKFLPRLFATTVALASMPAQAADVIHASREGRQIVIRSGNSEILRYQAEPGPLPDPKIPESFIRGGYIQSLRTPSGRLITDDFPADHRHHHGVWNPWTKTSFEGRHPDFWNMGQKTGKVEFISIDEIWQKNGKAGFSARHQFTDLTASSPKAALLETWNIVVSQANGAYLIDFTSTQTCATSSPLKLPEYHYGGFGFRGNAAWNQPGKTRHLSASGITDHTQLNSSREKWCWIGGEVDAATCGVTILCHPGNFRFPQPVRAHPQHPFFCYAPQQLGPMEITPAAPFISRYRLLVADGEPDAKRANEAWDLYAKSTATP